MTNRFLLAAVAMSLGAIPACAQTTDGGVQVHGFATQSYLRSGSNNYLGMDTSAGTTSWTEAAVNVNDQVDDKLRVGVQFHYTRFGVFGGDNVAVDWALGDYKVNEWFGVRAGKVKIPWGLYNDTQDYDPGYMWSLLPEAIYGLDIRSTNLSQLGAEVYGKIALGQKLGSLNYNAYYGDYFYASDDGYAASFVQQGLNFPSPPGGKTPGFDIRWQTPVRGLMLAGSLMMYDAKGTLTNGTYFQPLAFWPTYYGQYKFKKLFVSGQYVKLVQYQIVTTDGAAPATSVLDSRSWFAMGGYHLTSKLQVGAYYHTYIAASAADRSDPANHFHDCVVSSRYDINPNFYMKLEGHFVDGNGVGFYALDNLNGLKPGTNLVVAKAGFTF